MTGAPITLCRFARRAPQLTLRLAAFHAALLRHSRVRADRWFGSRLLLLETVGRASGLPRRAAVVYLPDGDDLVVVPANAGAARPPSWWLNLRAAGEATVQLGRERRRVRPLVADGAERERLWWCFPAATPVNHYERHAGRELPVVVLRRALA